MGEHDRSCNVRINSTKGKHIFIENQNTHACLGAQQPLRLQGKFQAAVESAKKVTVATFDVTDQPTGPNLVFCSLN